MHFHYAAPLVPLFWLGLTKGLAGTAEKFRTVCGWLVLGACAAAQIGFGPVQQLPGECRDFTEHLWERRWKAELLAKIEADPNTSVSATHPYLSHLAAREYVYSLHHVLKGLRTLSRQRYVPPPAPDYVVIDYADESTFNAAAGFYHPTMRTVNGDIVPSSEALLHEFLAGSMWSAEHVNSVAVLKRTGNVSKTEPSEPAAPEAAAAAVAVGKIERSADGTSLNLDLDWTLPRPRKQFRWCKLQASNANDAFEVIGGLAAPEAIAIQEREQWTVKVPPGIQAGEYRMRLLVYDRLGMLNDAQQGKPLAHVSQLLSLGTFSVSPGK
jgi:hypothetical protein